MLRISNLRVSIGDTPILNGISTTCNKGQRLGIVGESGSGKTMTALAVVGLLPESATATGDVSLNDFELLGRTEEEMTRIRGRKVSMIFQDSLTSLDPLMKVGRQMSLPLKLRNIAKAEAKSTVIELMESVQLDRPGERYQSYPHQLSGGQRQRVNLAMSLAGEPEVLIADEPTTALDVTVKARVAKLLQSVVDRTETSLILITHDLPLVAFICERIAVMYGGYIVEEGDTTEILRNPRHRYTAALIASMPVLRTRRNKGDRLPSIPGSVPAAGDFPSGCPFRNRCAAATAQCETMPETVSNGSHRFACWHPVEAPA